MDVTVRAKVLPRREPEILKSHRFILVLFGLRN